MIQFIKSHVEGRKKIAKEIPDFRIRNGIQSIPDVFCGIVEFVIAGPDFFETFDVG